MNKHIKYYTQKAEKVDDRTLEFIGSTEDIDRDHEVIKLSGWRLQSYRKNPVVLVNHNPSELPVAKTEKVWIDKDAKALKFRIKFPDPEVSAQGDTLYKLYKGGYMSATSVGFMPNREKMQFGDIEKNEPRVTFKEQELLEISLVSIPANPQAMITQRKMFDQAIEEDIVDELEVKDLEMWLKENGVFEDITDPPKEHECEGDCEECKEEPEVEEEKIDCWFCGNKAAIKENDGYFCNDCGEHFIDEKKAEESINSNDKCKSCGVEIECLCPKCLEEKSTQDYFEKFYTDIMFEKEEGSAE